MDKMLQCGGLGLQRCQSPPKESPKCPSSMNFKPVSSRSLIFALHDCTKTLMRDFDDDICYNWGIHPHTDLDSLPGILQKKYALLRDLDKSLQDIQRQNEHRCEREIEEIRRGVRSGNVTPNTSFVRFSDDALDEQKHSVRIADEKVALAVQAYDLVDTHIQQLDQYLKKFDEDLRREREAAAASAVPAPSLDGSTKAGRGSESGRGGRKKTRQATAAAAAANPTGMDLDLPVDPNEPTYCFCNQVSYGEMVACDNPDCKIEWFHFGCVGLKEQPKGKWYCSDCATVKSRRKGR